MIDVSQKNREHIRNQINAINAARQSLQSYVNGVADSLNIDVSKYYFDEKQIQFCEIEKPKKEVKKKNV